MHAGLPPSLVDWYHWPTDRAWLRCMMLTTLDGAARGHDGVSGSLSCPVDQFAFSEVRRMAHAVLVGAGTLRTEDYQPIRARVEDAHPRAALGMAPAPVLVVVSASLDLPWDAAVLTESDLQPIVVTVEGAPRARLGRAREVAEVVVLPPTATRRGPAVDAHQLVAAVAFHGLTRVVCDGGPHLLAHLTASRLVDEADITIAPILAGGGQVSTGRAVPEPQGFRLAALIESDGWLLTRYVRPESAPDLLD